MDRDLSKVKTIDLISESLVLLSAAEGRYDLEDNDQESITNFLDEKLGPMRDELMEKKDELEESLLEQDRRDGLRLRSQNQIPQEGR